MLSNAVVGCFFPLEEEGVERSDGYAALVCAFTRFAFDSQMKPLTNLLQHGCAVCMTYQQMESNKNMNDLDNQWGDTPVDDNDELADEFADFF